ncbi:leucine--tRNA ligase [Nanoarchaeota archaeon]
MEHNFKKIESKWQKKWEEKKIFEPEINSKKKKFFLTFPYPYINVYQHVGHFYTLMRVEALARYKRLKGFNVLFPQGWHATGSPIVSAAKRIKEKEPKQIKILKDVGVKEKDIKNFEDPKHWIDFFAPEYKNDYKKAGMSVDWRREFYTTSLNPHYNKFVQWQFKKLKEKNYCIQGEFPVVWDPVENTAIGDHDRIEGEGETTQDFIWGKFKMKDSDLILMAGTTRPDAFYGQTHLWIDPNATYKIVKVKNEKWVVGPEAVKKIEYQYSKPKVIGEIHAKELMGKWVKGPLVDYDIYVVPAWFIDANIGSGIVYSALEDPVDLFELERIHKNMDLIRQYNLDEKVIASLKPISIINIPGMGNNLGKEIGKEFRVKSPEDKKQIELAKGELNRRVFRKGIMKSNCGKCSGMTVQETQEYLKKSLVKKNEAVMFYEITGKVISRNLNECIVKVVKNQWFLDYANEKWKKETHKCLDKLKLYPEKARQQFDYVIDWLHEWACSREEGLGTRLPWDKKWLIESLSDSTIYMAYYTISHLITKFSIKELTDEFFDFIFLNKGKGKKKWEELKKEFEYWYPVDFRNSGKDLIQNHLTFFMFNHSAIFPEKHWPKGIGVNGWVTVDGNKMSKSIGNLILTRNVLEKYGADACKVVGEG